MKKKLLCPSCDKAAVSVQPTELNGSRNGESITISMEALVCANCGYKTVEKHRMGEFVLLVSDAYRKLHGLLSSAEIRERRKRLGMSQEQFAKHLGGVGIASIKRWELGQVQDEAMNTLILLRTDLGAAQRNVEQLVSLLGPIKIHFFDDGVLTLHATTGRESTPIFWPGKRKHQFQLPSTGWETAPQC